MVRKGNNELVECATGIHLVTIILPSIDIIIVFYKKLKTIQNIYNITILQSCSKRVHFTTRPAC